MIDQFQITRDIRIINSEELSWSKQENYGLELGTRPAAIESTSSLASSMERVREVNTSTVLTRVTANKLVAMPECLH